jgi:hypothetical protein
MVEDLIHDHTIDRAVGERHSLDGGLVEPRAITDPGLGELASGDPQHAGRPVEGLDPRDVAEQGAGVVAGPAAGIEHGQLVERRGRLREAADDDLDAGRPPGAVEVRRALVVGLVAAHGRMRRSGRHANI